MTSYITDGTVGEWAKEKLDCLERYLTEYTKILRKYQYKFYYVDAFAGAGVAKLRQNKKVSLREQLSLSINEERDDVDEVEFVNGSPRIALSLQHPFSGYLFVEQNKTKAAELFDYADKHGLSKRVKIQQGDANQVLKDKLLNNSKIDWTKTRALVFLDPFGLQVPWSTIEELGRTKAIEVIINFPMGMAIQRFLDTTGSIPPDRLALLNEYFGSNDWYDLVYEAGDDLWGENRRNKVSDAAEKLTDWYCSRLKAVFGRCASPRLIKNSSGGHLYYLIWAGKNSTGEKIADYILSGMAGKS